MAQVVVATYFENNRFGSMIERERVFGGEITIPQARTIVEKWVLRQREAGKPLYPGFDVVLERRAG